MSPKPTSGVESGRVQSLVCRLFGHRWNYCCKYAYQAGHLWCWRCKLQTTTAMAVQERWIMPQPPVSGDSATTPVHSSFYKVENVQEEPDV